ncbi:mitogen-activated protein kinase kinase kinase kinase 4 [Hyalella azteca]|uniref:Mitogen-activated protein kinase kinase kinase kinase 4 n=1 Tax=Hyalella azteca TaxID=294128 RepID=A0A8B7NH79_HYAAZ|nr:mitogen-activated protein kinase kinase kinase kinase 4 [Hyalella azteca]
MTSSLHQIVANSLWFAFDALDQHKLGVVDKSRLKELTRQIGDALHLERAVEGCLADYRSTDTLNFDQYLHFLEYEVFSDVCSADTPYSSMERHHAALDALMWEVGRHSLAPRFPSLLSPPETYKLFRVFCLLADRISMGGDLQQVSLRRCEVCEVCRQLVEGLGRDWDWNDWQMVSGSISTFSLPVFLTFIEGRYGENTEPSALSEAVESLFRMFVGQAIFQGRAYQRITRAGGWLRRDIEVTPWCIRASGEVAEELTTDDVKSHTASPGRLTAAVGRSLTLGRNAVGAMRTGVTEVVERSRTLTRSGSPAPSTKSEHKTNDSSGKRGLSLGRWGSASGINSKKRNADHKDSASLGGRESPVPHAEARRSQTLDRATLRSAKSSAALGSSPSPNRTAGGKTLSPRPAKESTKGIIGGVIGRVWKLDITPETEVTSLKDSASGKPCKISIVNTPTARPIVLAAQDHKSKARLMAALQEAILHCKDAMPYQMSVSVSRREEEAEEELRACEERIRRSSQADIIEQTQAELAAERTVSKLRDFEYRTRRSSGACTIRQQDEEIVRNLQARVLREEWAKREELERLQQEQQQLLEEEQRKRRAFEILQKEQEKKLREAEARLKALDSDRRRLDEELRAAREKIVMSGRGKQLLEAKMKVQEGRRPPIRTLSLRPSRQERSSPARSSSFTTSPHRTLLPSPTATDNMLPGSGITPATGSSPPRHAPREHPFARGSLYPRRAQTPGHSASSTPATSPAGANANRSILDYLESGGMNGSSGKASPSGSSSNINNSGIKSIPELKSEEEEGLQVVGWNVADETGVNGAEEPQEILDTSELKPVEGGLKIPKLSITSDVSEAAEVENFYEDGKKYIEIKTYQEKQTPSDENITTTVTTVTKTSDIVTADEDDAEEGSVDGKLSPDLNTSAENHGSALTDESLISPITNSIASTLIAVAADHNSVTTQN